MHDSQIKTNYWPVNGRRLLVTPMINDPMILYMKPMSTGLWLGIELGSG